MQLVVDEEEIQLLSSLANVDADTARRVYQKHNGDMTKAADALLGGDTGSEDHWSQRQNTRQNTPEGIMVTKSTTTTIDLTSDSSAYQTVPVSSFGPSTRAPDPNWQIVSSNAAVSSTPGISHDDQSLNEAIAASLNDLKSDEKDGSGNSVEWKDSLRQGGRPVAVRPESPSLQCPALVVQALFHIPQVRAAVGQLRLPDLRGDVALNHPARAVWNLIELFTNLDLAYLSAIADPCCVPSLENPEDRERTAENYAERARLLVDKIGPILDAHLSAQQDDDDPMINLFEYSHTTVELSNRLPRKVDRPTPGTTVRIEYGAPGSEHDLVPRLSANLSQYYEGKSSHSVIHEPSMMLAFALVRQPLTASQRKGDPIPFSFPKSFYLDRFLFINLELANRKRSEEEQISWEVQDLQNQRETLTRFEQRDAIQDLRNSIHYYEKVANAVGDSVKQQVLDDTATQLKDILTMIESKVEGIDQRIKDLEAAAENVYNVPELQQHQYDLRAVLMHTGLPGRKQLYSYVQDVDGVWWKTCDAEVTEVTEESVLSDTTGLHLNAGPFLLFYSQHMSPEELHQPVHWPKNFADTVEECNKKFLALLGEPENPVSAAATPPATSPPATSSHQASLSPPRSTPQYQPPLRSTTMGPRPAKSTSTKVTDTMQVD
ncbi:hypothetical protein BKA70DRAFT_90896 [Coprinopsis sp. MPI-PUGE-AT-0042]|nr:hypothetical protein BKA70DRAFT_90896 [Coprinopsis sp. MPI-PUGE-AT-0042]